MRTRGLGAQLTVTWRLYFRNRMALIYGYIFPIIFLITFWVLYRYDRVPLIRHMGELLTVAVLGGACFGLPTSMVSDRERGVWRRYRLTPASTLGLVTATVLARYGILLSAGLLQLVLAMALGMPLPRHPVELFVAFTFVAFAFLGLGLVIAMLADNVPAVQALGQCIFLPMLVIGGIAVRLDALPEWAQHLSAFFPGRYAVEAIQSCVTGAGLRAVTSALAALAIIGAAGCLAASKMFRWDSSQRYMTSEGTGWVGVALAAWVAVGVMTEARGRAVARLVTSSDYETVNLREIVVPGAASQTGGAPALETPGAEPLTNATAVPNQGPHAVAAPPPVPAAAPSTGAGVQTSSRDAGRGAMPETALPPRGAAVTPGPRPDSAAATGGPGSASAANASRPGEPPPATARTEEPAIGPPRWQDVTLAMIEHDILFDRLPPDGGIVTPIAPMDEEPTADLYDELDTIAAALPTWPPGLVSDPIQKVRNLLYVAAVPDVLQMPVERHIPAIVFTQIEQAVPKDTLIKVLYWIGVHPDEGDDSAASQLQPFGLGSGPNDIGETRGRAAVYAVKLLGRLTGKRPAR